MNLIELHILQSFPVTCLNRDDVGAPKSAIFGGAPRARVSSQCWKRAIRLAASERLPGRFSGKRGHYFAAVLQSALMQHGITADKAKQAAEAVATLLGEQDKKRKEEHKTSVALYLSPGEVEAVAAKLAEKLKAEGDAEIKKGDVKKILDAVQPKDAADISLFGRMVASDHSLTLEGAGLFSHALSTHKVSGEVDFFSAVDELKDEDEDAGAGHIGSLEFNSACYYRYVGLNIDLLRDKDHLGHFKAEECRETVDAFLRAAIEAVPSARHNSMFGHTPVGFVLGLSRRGQPLSLANAFEKPVISSSGYVEKSKEAMEAHFAELKKLYGLTAEEHRLPPENMEALVKSLATHVQ
jgi:CRISPR system Cascade subunit CasC